MLFSQKGPPKTVEKGDFRIRTDVNLVVLHASVLDKDGNFVSGLDRASFRVFEDRVEQKIAHFSQEDIPISVGVVVDTSGSMRNKIHLVTQAALKFIDLSHPEDEIFLVNFDKEVQVAADFTSDADEVKDALENLIFGGGTALYDAVYLATEMAAKGRRQKRALLIFTDGEDKDSYYGVDQLREKVREADVQIYTVGFLNLEEEEGGFFSWGKSAAEKAKEVLEKIAEESGGKALFPKQLDELSGMASEVARELRNQYSIGYVSSNAARDGSWRRLDVKLELPGDKKYRLRTRTGYYAHKSKP